MRSLAPVAISTNGLEPVIRAIGALSDLYDNSFTSSKNGALDAVQAGRAVFWSTASYHNQKAQRLLDAANNFGLTNVLSGIADDDHPSYAARTPYLLGTLIPLNAKAREEINRAWQTHAEGQRAPQLQAAE